MISGKVIQRVLELFIKLYLASPSICITKFSSLQKLGELNYLINRFIAEWFCIVNEQTNHCVDFVFDIILCRCSKLKRVTHVGYV